MICKKIWEPNHSSTFYNNHVTFSSVSYIKNLLIHLKNINVTYFTFDRTYKDGSHIKLTSAGEWIEHYYREKLYNVAIFEQDPNVFSESLIFWSWLKRDPVYSAASLFGIDHGVTISQPHKNYCDFFHFGNAENQYISQQTIMSNANLLYKFIALFKDKACKLILESEDKRFILPIKSLTDINLNDVMRVEKHVLTADIRRLYLGDEFNNAYLTKKEIEILFNLTDGNNLTTIADRLFISVRTAQTHVNHIKEKLKCKSMFELGVKTNALGIKNLLTA